MAAIAILPSYINLVSPAACSIGNLRGEISNRRANEPALKTSRLREPAGQTTVPICGRAPTQCSKRRASSLLDLASPLIQRSVVKGENAVLNGVRWVLGRLLSFGRFIHLRRKKDIMRRGLQIGKILGIPILLDPSWLFIFGLLTYALSVSFAEKYPQWSNSQHWVVGTFTSLLFFGS